MGRRSGLIRPIIYPRSGAGGDPEFRTSAEVAAMNDEAHFPPNVEQQAEEYRVAGITPDGEQPG